MASKTTVTVWVAANDEPRGKFGVGSAWLYVNGDSHAVVGMANHDYAAYLRRLATEADKLADAIDARLAESTTGETRDVPMPGAAT